MWFTPNRREKEAAKAGLTVSEDGTKVYKPCGKLMPLDVTTDGYRRFSFGPKDKRSSIRVHRFQAWFTFGEAMYAPGILCRHKDGNPGNNHRDNIILGTQKDNMNDRPADIRKAHAFATSRHVLKHDHVAILAHYRAHGWTSTRAVFNIGRGALSFIINKSQTGVPVSEDERKAVLKLPTASI